MLICDLKISDLAKSRLIVTLYAVALGYALSFLVACFLDPTSLTLYKASLLIPLWTWVIAEYNSSQFKSHEMTQLTEGPSAQTESSKIASSTGVLEPADEISTPPIPQRLEDVPAPGLPALGLMTSRNGSIRTLASKTHALNRKSLTRFTAQSIIPASSLQKLARTVTEDGDPSGVTDESTPDIREVMAPFQSSHPESPYGDTSQSTNLDNGSLRPGRAPELEILPAVVYLAESGSLDALDNVLKPVTPVDEILSPMAKSEINSPTSIIGPKEWCTALHVDQTLSDYAENGLKFVFGGSISDFILEEATEESVSAGQCARKHLNIDHSIKALPPDQLALLNSPKCLRLCKEGRSAKAKRSNRKTDRTRSEVTIAERPSDFSKCRRMHKNQHTQPAKAAGIKTDKHRGDSSRSGFQKDTFEIPHIPQMPYTRLSPPYETLITPQNSLPRKLNYFPLFQLPRELRDLVYSYAAGGRLLHFSSYDKKPYQLCVEKEQENCRNHWRCFAAAKRLRWNPTLPIIPLLLTSKQVYLEVLPIVYRTNFFSFLHLNAFKNFNRKFRPRTLVASLDDTTQAASAAKYKASFSSRSSSQARKIMNVASNINLAKNDRRIQLLRLDLEFFSYINASRPQPKGDNLSHVSDFPSQDLSEADDFHKEIRQLHDLVIHAKFPRLIVVSGNIDSTMSLHSIDRTMYRILANMGHVAQYLSDGIEIKCEIKGFKQFEVEDKLARKYGYDRMGEDCKGSEIVRRGDGAFCEFAGKMLGRQIDLPDLHLFRHVYCWKELKELPESYPRGLLKEVEEEDDS